jgi:hypothetical protein
MSLKYPRTSHFPFSPGGESDDKRMKSVGSLLKVPLVFTEKLDGSNVSLEREGCFARSHGKPPSHPSFDAFKALWASLRDSIPDNLQVFGEWLWAKHSIAYTALPAYLTVFGVRNAQTLRWHSWAEVEECAASLGLPTVPVLAQPAPAPRAQDLQAIVERFAVQPSACGGEREGVVVRWACGFGEGEFSRAVGKWVRKDHVSSGDHWMHGPVVRNGLRPTP